MRCAAESEVLAQVCPAKRLEVKTQPGKVNVSSKVKKPVAKAKPASKAAAKPVAKKVVKPAVKAKPVSKAPAKPAAKKTAPKPVAAKKPVAKKTVTAKKPVAKPVTKSTVKPVVKTTKVAAKKAAPPAKTTKPAAKAKPVKAPAKPKASVKPAVVVVAPPVEARKPTTPARAGRPSSRLAQITVPSMAQSVASTAAKASYSQVMSSPLIVPPSPSTIKKDPKLANNWKTKPVEQLTDADLLAMPDSEYMNEVQLKVFRLKLQVLKQDILSSAGETTEHLREDTVVVPDPADRATIEEEHALELRTRDRERKLLKKIEQSINRIDAGDYGYCDETGEPIGVGRLLARPTATLSLEAQQRRELKQKMFGD
jgi:DnaK suppressor protein